MPLGTWSLFFCPPLPSPWKRLQTLPSADHHAASSGQSPVTLIHSWSAAHWTSARMPMGTQTVRLQSGSWYLPRCPLLLILCLGEQCDPGPRLFLSPVSLSPPFGPPPTPSPKSTHSPSPFDAVAKFFPIYLLCSSSVPVCHQVRESSWFTLTLHFSSFDPQAPVMTLQVGTRNQLCPTPTPILGLQGLPLSFTEVPFIFLSFLIPAWLQTPKWGEVSA